MSEAGALILSIDDVEVVYDRIILALRGVSLEVRAGSIVALLGANGAGKTTTLKAASALIGAERGELSRGSISYRGRPQAKQSPRELGLAGLVQVLEGRRCFPHLTVEENLITGALLHRPSRAALAGDLEKVYAHFPRLRERRRSQAGYLSGGEQQMLAIGRALMARPRLVLLDEPSMGLAPQIVGEIFEIVKDLNQREGVSFLLAEQNATVALRYADFGYILENGRVVVGDTAARLRERPDVKELYLGAGAEGRESFRRGRPPARGLVSVPRLVT